MFVDFGCPILIVVSPEVMMGEIPNLGVRVAIGSSWKKPRLGFGPPFWVTFFSELVADHFLGNQQIIFEEAGISIS